MRSTRLVQQLGSVQWNKNKHKKKCLTNATEKDFSSFKIKKEQDTRFIISQMSQTLLNLARTQSPNQKWRRQIKTFTI